MTSVPSSRVTPAEAALSGAVAGLVATILVSVLARSTPGIRTQAFYKRRENHREIADEQSEHPATVTPAGALAQAHGPGPEGAAGLFAMKVASGLFGRDIARSSRLWGKVVHLAYGSFWGMVLLPNSSVLTFHSETAPTTESRPEFEFAGLGRRFRQPARVATEEISEQAQYCASKR